MKEQLEGYRDYLGRLPVSPHTRRAYLGRLRTFLAWLEGTADGEQALCDPVARDFAIQDFKLRLLQLGFTSNTVNATLAALDNFYLYTGMGAANVRRQDLPAQAPRALEAQEQRRLLKVIAQSKSHRNRAIALVMLMAGLRISEVRGLNVGDVLLSARKHELIVRCGKNAKRRVVPIHSDLAPTMRELLFSMGNPDAEAPLFTSQKGNRMSVQAIDQVIRQFGRDAGVELSAHSLRHTCLTRLVRAGVDIVVVAELAGHARLETTRRYSLPTGEDKVSAMEQLTWCNASIKTANAQG